MNLYIPNYSEAEFHTELHKLSDLSQKSEHTDATKNKIAKYIHELLIKYRQFLNARDIEHLPKIVTFLSKIPCSLYYNTADAITQELFEKFSQLVTMPAEMLIRLPLDTTSFLSVRKTCRKLYQTFPIGEIPLSEKGIDTWRKVTLLRALIRKQLPSQAHLLLNRILQKSSLPSQKQFWQHFGYEETQELRKLFKNPFGAKTLILPHTMRNVQDCLFGLKDQELQNEWVEFFSEAIEACSGHLEHLEIASPHKGAFPPRLLSAILKCQKLQHLDIANFYLTKPRDTISLLSHFLPLKTLQIHARFSPDLLELPTARLFTKVFLRFDEESDPLFEEDRGYPPQFYERPADERKVKDFLVGCTKVRHFRLNCPSLLTHIPQEAETLEIVLPENDPNHQFIESIQQPPLTVRSLKFFSSAQSRYRMQEIIEILEKIPKLETLEARELSPRLGGLVDYEESWLSLLCEKKSLRNLACQVRYTNYDAHSVSLLCRQLTNLELYLPDRNDPADARSISMSINEESRLVRLAIKAQIREPDRHPLHYIAAFLAACNPEEIVFLEFTDSRGRTIKDITVHLSDDGELFFVHEGISASLTRLTRLKRVLFCDSTCWDLSCDGNVIAKRYGTYEFEKDGKAVHGYAIDLDR